MSKLCRILKECTHFLKRITNFDEANSVGMKLQRNRGNKKVEFVISRNVYYSYVRT